jgi:hypothetical protein
LEEIEDTKKLFRNYLTVNSTALYKGRLVETTLEATVILRLKYRKGLENVGKIEVKSPIVRMLNSPKGVPKL